MAKKILNEESEDTSQPKGTHGENSPYEATREVVRRHLSNKDDVITDEDIANAYTGSPVVEPEEDEALTKARAKDLERSKKEDEDDDQTDELIAPSDIIGE